MEASQAELEDEEAISGTGEGDEIMKEVGDQEEGYSECSGLETWISSVFVFAFSSSISSLRALLNLRLRPIVLCSIIDPYFDTYMDQLVLLPPRPRIFL